MTQHGSILSKQAIISLLPQHPASFILRFPLRDDCHGGSFATIVKTKNGNDVVAIADQCD